MPEGVDPISWGRVVRAENRLAEIRTRVSGLELSLANITRGVDKAEAEARKADSRAQRLRARLEAWASERAVLEADLAFAESRREAADAVADARRPAVSLATDRLQAAQQELQAAEQELRDAQGSLEMITPPGPGAPVLRPRYAAWRALQSTIDRIQDVVDEHAGNGTDRATTIAAVRWMAGEDGIPASDVPASDEEIELPAPSSGPTA